MRSSTRNLIIAGVVLVGVPIAATVYYESPTGNGCASCHEIRPSYDKWSLSAHREVSCTSCHGDALTTNLSFHMTNLRRVIGHLRGGVSENILLRQPDLSEMQARCQNCHRQEFADWLSGPHAANYSRIFLDRTQNTKQKLQDDCLRCHGMHFQGGIRDLVEPTDSVGPWRLVKPELANLPTMPCLTCHEMHTHGDPLPHPATRTAMPGPKQETFRPSLTFFDRRAQQHFALRTLPLPVMREGERMVKISPDQRQALCYQCHAPRAGNQVGSGDDRTPLGVHEGLSCLACHLKHGQQTRASCANCHPRLSNCGLDVETMDTTFKNFKSPHNIHFVKCADCHPKGIPPKKAERLTRR